MKDEERVELDPHPIRDEVARLLRDGSEEPAALDAPATRHLAAVVDAYVDQGDHELQEVIQTLIAIHDWLAGEMGSPRAADALKSAFKTPRVMERVQAIEDEMRAAEADDASQRGTQFGAFADPGAQRSAPKVGEPAPEGSVKLGDLDFPKKL